MDNNIIKPSKPCFNCGGEEWWQRIPDGHFVCKWCHPFPDSALVMNSEVS
jgi:hypothetical protein